MNEQKLKKENKEEKKRKKESELHFANDLEKGPIKSIRVTNEINGEIEYRVIDVS